VDEAQDLSPMQLRMLARRAPHGSITILGDLAQATGPWTYAHWDEILAYLPDTATVRRDELTLGYRAPGQVLDLASRLLPEAAPTVRPTESIRRGRSEPALIRVAESELLPAALREATRLSEAGMLVGLVVPPARLAEVARLARGRADVGILERDAMTRPVTIVDTPGAKGLEFDAAVVVEPAEIAAGGARGLRLLYIAMTRPIQHLSLVHAADLPAPLRSPGT
ncbi:MAG TPA: hypothetical protein VL961_05670, partial [Acidimicrobiales bacterium]|nr:hypothetical protein [Acidimicrobiales bacterium]